MVEGHAGERIYRQQYAGTLADQRCFPTAEKRAGADTYAIILARKVHVRDFTILIAAFYQLTEPLIWQAGHQRNASALE